MEENNIIIFQGEEFGKFDNIIFKDNSCFAYNLQFNNRKQIFSGIISYECQKLPFDLKCGNFLFKNVWIKSSGTFDFDKIDFEEIEFEHLIIQGR
jgi:hypothetical protein